MRYVARVGEREFRIEVAPRGGGRFTISLDGKTREIERRGDGVLHLLSIDGGAREVTVVRDTGGPGGAGHGRPAGPREGGGCVTVAGRAPARGGSAPPGGPGRGAPPPPGGAP